MDFKGNPINSALPSNIVINERNVSYDKFKESKTETFISENIPKAKYMEDFPEPFEGRTTYSLFVE